VINSVRTYLANLAGQGFVRGDGEEYTDPAFVPVALPGYLQTLRAILYGADPDRRAVLYRTRQFLGVLHATRLGDEYVRVDDPRITYLPVARGGLELAPNVAVSPLGGSPPLILTGPIPAADASGRLASAWTLSVVAGPALQVATPALQTSTPLVFVGGLSQPVSLQGSGLTATVPDSAAVGSGWTVEAFAVPTADLGELVARLDVAGAEVLVELFGVDPDEPYLSWTNLWADTTMPLPYRLGAVLLAVAARTRETQLGI
jgi:hypothetical protein